MKNELVQLKEFKKTATRLEQELAVEGYTSIGHTKMLNILAKAVLNVENFRTLKGMLEKQPVPAKEAFRSLDLHGMTYTLFLESYVCDEYGDGPGWARVEVTQSWLDDLVRLANVAQAEKLELATKWDSPDEWENNLEYRMQAGSLNVTNDGAFWFRSNPKHVSYEVETQSIDLDALRAAIIEANGRFLSFNMDAESLISALEQNEDAIAEGIGQHYGHNYDAMDAELKVKWVLQYVNTFLDADLADTDLFECVHCGSHADIEDSIQTDVGLVCSHCQEQNVATLDSNIQDWRIEIQNGDTKLGFAEWMLHKREDREEEARHQQGQQVQADALLRSSETQKPLQYVLNVAQFAQPGASTIRDERLAVGFGHSKNSQTDLLAVVIEGEAYALVLSGYVRAKDTASNQELPLNSTQVLDGLLEGSAVLLEDAGAWFEWVVLGTGDPVGDVFDAINLNPEIEVQRLRNMLKK